MIGISLKITQNRTNPNLATNSNFATAVDLTGWAQRTNANVAASPPGISLVGGRLRNTNASASAVRMHCFQVVSLVPGVVYRLTSLGRYVGTDTAAGVQLRDGIVVAGGTQLVNFYSFSNAGVETQTFTALSTSGIITFYNGVGTIGAYAEFDGVTLTRA
jgi:hypothetical protein